MKRILAWPALILAVLALEPAWAADTAGQPASGDARGKEVYKRANCVGCHKWHGDGGGGYGGAAKSLRKTGLDRDQIITVVRCGRPGTGMPYHERSAYQGDSKSCYDVTAQKLGSAVPPRAREFLRPELVEVVTDYVLTHLKGHGDPNRSECVAFWGENTRQCDEYKQ